MLEAVTKDQLNTGLNGQIRYRVSERNLYAYLFGVKRPIVHVMGYFVSILRERIANFEAPHTAPGERRRHRSRPRWCAASRSTTCARTCATSTSTWTASARSSAARYGIELDASLITGIDPPAEVESALAAINTAHNHVSSEISLAQAAADQKIVQSKRAVEIETLKAQAEVEPLLALADQLADAQGERRHGRPRGLRAQPAAQPAEQGPAGVPGGALMISQFLFGGDLLVLRCS